MKAMLTGDLDGAADKFADGFTHNGKAVNARQFVEGIAAEARRGGEGPETMVAERFSGRYGDTIGDESPLPEDARQKVESAGGRLDLSGGDLVVILGSEKDPFWLWLYWKKQGGRWKVIASEG